MMLHIKRRFFWFMKLTDMFDNTFATVLAGLMFWSAAYLRKNFEIILKIQKNKLKLKLNKKYLVRQESIYANHCEKH